VADRAGGPSEEAKRILQDTAGPARRQKIREARSRLTKQPKVPASASLLINIWQELALDLAEKLLREQQSARVNSRRQHEKASSRSIRAFVWGFVLGAIAGSVAVFLWMKQS
jgi:type VI protein secretion system component VasF